MEIVTLDQSVRNCKTFSTKRFTNRTGSGTVVVVSTETERGRGRPREFDEGAVLDRLIDVFASRGFEAASLADIVETAGLNKSSLYNAFGSKDELFRRVLDRYVAQRLAMLELVAAGDDGLDDVAAMVGLLRQEALSDAGQYGCLAMHTTAELGRSHPDIAACGAAFRAGALAALRRPLRRAADRGEIDEAMIDSYGDTLFAFMSLFATLVRAGAPEAEVKERFDSLLTLVESWRV